GDAFKFVMEMEKCEFPEAVRVVAEKCGIPIPRPRERSPEEHRENRLRAALIEMHREAAAFFARQLNDTPEGKAARGYLEDRGLDRDAIARFGLGYSPAGGDVLYRFLKQKYPDKLLEPSGLIQRDQSGGRFYDKFRRRIMFPISNDSGKVIAFGGRALGDDMPKYMNSPETPVYSKSNVLYHLDRAKAAIRQKDFAILVEGYMDTIAVARAGFTNVVASCGTSLAEPQVKLLSRFTKNIMVNFDPDTAGQAAAERSLAVLLEKEFEIKVVTLPGGADPDKFLKENGTAAYEKELKAAPPYLNYLISRARGMDLTTASGKLAALNYLMPYVQRVPNRLIRSEWASRIASELRVDEPVLREALRRAATERHSEVKPKAELLSSAVRQADRRLMQMLVEAEGFRQRLAQEILDETLHKGLDTEKIFEVLLGSAITGAQPDPALLAESLAEQDRRMFFSVVFESAAPPSWDEAESCLGVLRRRHVETELLTVQKEIDARPPIEELLRLQRRKQELELRRRLGEHSA
ncbi:MAG TPA: DNA primase, partial [Candidatus Acidoferrales bacterium]|nr:DNA primase [Candidatus Acidoferrales bacterium]